MAAAAAFDDQGVSSTRVVLPALPLQCTPAHKHQRTTIYAAVRWGLVVSLCGAMWCVCGVVCASRRMHAHAQVLVTQRLLRCVHMYCTFARALLCVGGCCCTYIPFSVWMVAEGFQGAIPRHVDRLHVCVCVLV